MPPRGHDHIQHHHLGHMQRAYHEMCPTAEAYKLHDDDDEMTIISSAHVASNVPAARDRMVGGVAG